MKGVCFASLYLLIDLSAPFYSVRYNQIGSPGGLELIECVAVNDRLEALEYAHLFLSPVLVG